MTSSNDHGAESANAVQQWKRELTTELAHRELQYRERAAGDDEDYWNGVANGLSEAIDLVEESGNEQ